MTRCKKCGTDHNVYHGYCLECRKSLGRTVNEAVIYEAVRWYAGVIHGLVVPMIAADRQEAERNMLKAFGVDPDAD